MEEQKAEERDRDRDSTHGSKVRGLVDHSCALLLPDVVISHHLEGAGLATLP